MPDSPPPKPPAPSRKPNRDAQPTDLADRIVALQRRQAAVTKPRERAERPSAVPSSTARPCSPRRMHAPPLPNPNIVVSHTMDADADDFSRRLKISASSPRGPHSKAQPSRSGSPAKLYNTNAEYSRRPILTAEPDNMSDGASSSYAPRGPAPHGARVHAAASQSRGGGADSHRQLFDYRKDDPVRFSVLARPQGGSPHAANNGGGQSSGRPTPTPKSSGDYVSASSTSSASYAHSTLSSNFTLSSATTDSSAPSSLFDNANGHARRSEDSASGTNAFSIQLKKLYRAISALEAKILGEDREKDREDDGEREVQRVGVLVKGRAGTGAGAEDETERWRRLMTDHKELAEKMHQMLSMTLAPSVPASLRNIATKYNIIIRLWTHAFHRLLESLRRAASPPNNSAIALEYLQDLIYYAYAFYSGLLEERNLSDFRSTWVEALGDLARYRMATCALLDNLKAVSSSLGAAGTASLSNAHFDAPRVPADAEVDDSSDKPEIPSLKRASASPTPAARIDDSPPLSHVDRPAHNEVPSVGLAAARLMELEPEKERWRQIAREWFARGLALTPGAGKLHHHLGLLSRDDEGSDEELRAVYHFVKSMIALHPFSKARESILQIWAPAAQARRQAPDAELTELFALLHGMLFTNIQLDDFRRVLDRFEEKLNIDDGAAIQERDWIMMSVVNLAAVLEYGRPNAVLRRISGIGGREAMIGRATASPAVAHSTAGKVKLMSKKAEDDDRKMNVDGEEPDDAQMMNQKPSPMHVSPPLSDASPISASPELPISVKYGMQLAFNMFARILQRPMRKPSPFMHSTLNPYIPVFMTFLATTLKDAQALSVVERMLPWTMLARFLTSAPRRVMSREFSKERTDPPPLLTSGCSPLPEDWSLRGMGWGGKRVYPQGFWGKEAGSEERNVELEVLDRVDTRDQMEVTIEDGDKPDSQTDAQQGEYEKRWVRVVRAGLKMARYVDGFSYVPPTAEDGRGQWRVEGVLAEKVARWQEEDRLEREEEERRLRGRRWNEDSMDVDDDESLAAEASEDESDSDADDTSEIKALKTRRRHLQSLLQPSRREPASPPSRRRRPRGPTKTAKPDNSSRIVPGYTILVIDTNILLSSLTIFSSLIESSQWTVVVPLPVVMELDGLSRSSETELGAAAAAALEYITGHVRSHAISLKVQTSKGNYLANLNVRTEEVDFSGDESSWERNMDDLILRATIWQDEHWIDRSALLKSDLDARNTAGAAKVLLLSFDRMLRLKARSRQLSAATEKELASILAPAR